MDVWLLYCSGNGQLLISEFAICLKQGHPYMLWKTWKVIESYDFSFEALKVMKLKCGSWKVMEKQFTSENKRAKRAKVDKIKDKSEIKF